MYKIFATRACCLLIPLALFGACAAEKDQKDRHFDAFYASFRSGQYDSALYWLDLMRQEADDSLALGRIENNTASVYIKLGNNVLATYHLENAIASYPQDAAKMRAEALYNQALIYKKQSLDDLAVKNLYTYMGIMEEYGEAERLHKGWNVLGNIERNRGNISEAFRWHRQCLDAASAAEAGLRAEVLNNLAQDYMAEDDPAAAIMLLRQSLAIKDSLGEEANRFTGLLNLALAYRDDHSYDSALSCLQEALRVDSRYRQEASADKLLIEYARTLMEQEAPRHRIDSILQAAAGIIADGSSLPDVMLDYYELRFDWLQKEKRYAAANALVPPLLQTYALLNDTRREKNIERLSIEYQLAQRDMSIATQKVELQATRLREWIWILAVCLVLLLLMLVALSWQRLSRQKSRVEKEKLARETMLRAFAHLIKNNLSSFEGILSMEMQRHRSGLPQKLLQENKNRLHAISAIHSRLNLMQHDALGSIPPQGYLQDLSYDVILSFGYQPAQLRIHYDISLAAMEIDRLLLLGQLLCEALTNSCKYAIPQTAEPVLSIILRQEGEELLFGLADNGPGFDPAQISEGLGMQLFQAFALELRARWELDTREGSRHTWRFPA